MVRAERDLAVAANVIDDLPDVAARHAYMAAYRAAQAFLFERTGRVAKTDRGVQSEFSRLVKDIPDLSARFASFLGRAYRYKEIADYGADPARDIPPDQAREALATARAFVAWLRGLV